MTWCQCEHASHLPESEPYDITVDGHLYGASCDETVDVKTMYGTFKVCKTCAETHMAEWLRREAAAENDE